MRIEKLARWALVIVGLSIGITACDIDRAKYEKQCLAEEQIHLRYNEISLKLLNDDDTLNLSSIQLYHIRNGLISELLYKHCGDHLEIENLDLLTSDTIIVRVRDPAREAVLHDFRNLPSWGGKNFLGCFLFTFKINGKVSSLGGWDRIYIPNDSKS